KLPVEPNKIFEVHDTKVHALKNVSFNVDKGEVLSVLGASGSGKSTLLRLIAGLEDADEGTIHVGGAKITGPRDHLVPGYDNINMVFQDFQLSKNLTVCENIKHILRDYQDEYARERVENVMGMCRLEEKSECYPRELSGGQQQRVGIAMALANEPEVILLDEPFSNLDYQLKTKLRSDLQDIVKKSGVTAIFVSHDPQDALTIADRIIVLQSGSVVQIDTPEKLYQNPSSEYIARFLGPVNVVDTQQGKEELVRPENLIIHPDGEYEGKVIRCYFYGSFYLVEIKSRLSAQPMVIYSQHSIRKGNTVRFFISNK
ncbi:MAG TPA: ABC transporter ATP-binding protein, partial [Cytophagales bacterium]|nr:ABC transporter ATP-binding protein [Cytophagales bacterium]